MNPRGLPISCSWSFDFGHPVHAVWPLVTNTDRMNRAAGVPPVEYVQEPLPEGGSRRIGKFKALGVSFHWVEHPYEWVKHRYYRVERDYVSGTFKRMDAHWEFTPIAGGCRVTQTFSFEPANWLFGKILTWQLNGEVRKGFLKAYRQTADFLDRKAASAFLPAPEDPRSANEEQVSRTAARLREAGVEPGFAAEVASFVFSAQPPDLVRLRPFVMARLWNRDRLETLTMFLRATQAGVFTLSWDLLCPSCRGAKDRSASLAAVKNTGHCDACNIGYGVEFDRSVELSFAVNRAVREIRVGEFCVGGPQNTPHYLTQLRIPAGGTRETAPELGPGLYRLRSPQARQSYLLEVSAEKGGGRVEAEASRAIEAEASRAIEAAFGRGPEGERGLAAKSGPVALLLRNEGNCELSFILERAEWLEDACTAAYVTCLQEFRDRFSSEVLRPGQEISVRAVTLLFTDLKGSTSLYHRIGDATAFSLVRDHFDVLIDCVRRHEGGLVKTIGDAVMASFARPEDAVRAAMEIHARIEAANAASPGKEKLRIKVGIHTGPCFAVNLNDRLDYFGTTVNIAARTEGQCEGGDIVITERMMREPEVAAAVGASGHPVTRMSKALKGFDDQFELYRIECVAGAEGKRA